MSLKPRPVNLEKFPGVREKTVLKLKKVGIKNTLNLFERVKTPRGRAELADQLDINPDEIMDLTKLTDLSRVKWVGPIFARIFLDSGTDTVDKLAKAAAQPLYKKLVAINQEKKYINARFVETDVQLCVDFARKIPKVIEY